MSYLLDTGKAMSDGSTWMPTDLQASAGSNVPPLTPPRRINAQVLWARAIVDVQLTLSAVAETLSAAYFTLAQLPDHGSYEAIFDQYSIPFVCAKIRGGENVGTGTGGPPPRFYTVLDFDDENTISVAAAKEYATCSESRIFDSVTRMLHPRIAVAAYSGAFTSYANQRSWIDCGSNTVRHYGLKLAVEADTRAVIGEILARYEVYYCFRNRH